MRNKLLAIMKFSENIEEKTNNEIAILILFNNRDFNDSIRYFHYYIYMPP